MVDGHTWERSYFKTPGTRLLYIVPRPWVDEILPITITLKPDELVRTMVGRIELSSDSDARKMLGELRAGSFSVDRSDRFTEAKLQRILSMDLEPEVRTTILNKILEVRTAAGN